MRVFKFAALFAFFAASSAPSLALAQQAPPQVSPPEMGTLLTVSADGKSTGRPDMATISLGVTTEGQTAQAALQANATRMTSLTQALRRAGVAERDIQTSNVSVNPQYTQRDNEQPRISGYQANNTVSAKVRNLDTLGRVIDASVGAGGNNVNGVSFSYQNPDQQLDAARRDAVSEARRRATLYAQALNLRVHRIVAVSEGGGYSPPIPLPMMARAQAMDVSTPISPGEIETHVSLSVTFELR